MYNNFLAKSIDSQSGDRVCLVEHSLKVANLAEKIFDNIQFNKHINEVNKLKNSLLYSCLLHDIGKTNDKIQKFFKTGKGGKNIDKTLSHAIYGACFLIRTHNSEIKSKMDINEVCFSILKHHGSKYPNNNENFKNFTDRDTILLKDRTFLSNMKSISDFIISEYNRIYNKDLLNFSIYSDDLISVRDMRDYDINNFNYYSRTLNTPSDETERMNHIIRYILVTSDRLVSRYKKLSNDEILHIYLNNKELNKQTDLCQNIESFYNSSERTMEQIGISKMRGNIVVKATAGFGKTNIGVMWLNNIGKKAIWVCPTNVVVDSVYNNIIEINNQFGVNFKLSKVLSNELVETNSNDINDNNYYEASDIVVTNIDCFLNPFVNNSRLESMLDLINFRSVIFDEFHEFECKSAYYSMFLNIAKYRNCSLGNTNTLYLSATPNSVISKMDNVTIYPSKIDHTKGAHDKLYRFVLIDDVDVNQVLGGDAVYFNTIKNSQKFFLDLESVSNNVTLVHSYFKDIKSRISNIVKEFGKENINNIKENIIVTTQILQSSYDISFNNLYIKLFSPERMLQQIGRCNRHGANDLSMVFIIESSDKSNKSAINNLYSTELHKEWLKYVKGNFIGKDLTLDEIYRLYNSFYEDREVRNKLHSYLDTILDESVANLRKIEPVKYSSEKDNTIIRANSNKIRITNTECFFVCRNIGEDVFDNHCFTTIQREDTEEKMGCGVNNTTNNDKSYLIVNHGFNYDKSSMYGKSNISPILNYNEFYHKKLGVIDNEIKNLL